MYFCRFLDFFCWILKLQLVWASQPTVKDCLLLSTNMRKWPRIMAFLCALAASFLFPTTGLSNGFCYLPALPSSEWFFNSRCYLLQDGCASIDERHLWSSTATRVVEILESEMGVRPLENPGANETWKKTHTQLPSWSVEAGEAD